MQKHFLLLVISLAFVAGLSLTAVNAIDLPSDFDEPCPSGMSVLQVTCVGVNLNHDKIDVNTSDIDNLQSSLVTIQDHIDEHHLEVSILNTENDGVEARLFALENEKQEFNIELNPFGTVDGRIQLNADAILFYGSELCKIEGGQTNAYIEFGNTTVVKHDTDCAPNVPGFLIFLDSSTDEIFNKGDLLILELNFISVDLFEFQEVYQEKN